MATGSFAKLTPDDHATPDTGSRGRAHPPSLGPARHTPRRARWAWIGAGAGLLAVLVVFALWPSGEPGAGAGSVRAAHGPTRVSDGVPAGYTRDAAGAATAAVNLVQALAQAGQGRVAMSAVVATMIAPNPGPGLAKSIEIGRDRPSDDAVLSVLPAAVTLTSFTDTTAEVEVWTVGVSRASITPGDPMSVSTLWSSNTVSLVWAEGDWKATEKTGRVGPTPEDFVTPAGGSALTKPLVSGYYSLYIN